jgi:hypothetical protein
MRTDLLPRCLAKRRDIGLDVFAGGRVGAGPSDLCARNIPPADSSLPFSLLPFLPPRYPSYSVTILLTHISLVSCKCIFSRDAHRVRPLFSLFQALSLSLPFPSFDSDARRTHSFQGRDVSGVRGGGGRVRVMWVRRRVGVALPGFPGWMDTRMSASVRGHPVNVLACVMAPQQDECARTGGWPGWSSVGPGVRGGIRVRAVEVMSAGLSYTKRVQLDACGCRCPGIAHDPRCVASGYRQTFAAWAATRVSAAGFYQRPCSRD